MTDAQVDLSARQRAFLILLYQVRLCAICQGKTWCAHREPLVDLAEHRIYKDPNAV
jgi:hypothetical protein